MPTPTNPVTPTPTPTPAPAPTQPVDPRDVLTATRAATSVGGSFDARADLFNPNIVAKPLTSSNDPFFALRPKNPNVVFRGITHTVMTNDGPSYMRFEQAKSQGYVVATVADVDGVVPPSLIREGKIINGDLILMKIDAAMYRGAIKWKDQQALRATQRAGKLDSISAEIKKSAQETNTPSKLSRKLSPFSPTADEMKHDFGTDE